MRYFLIAACGLLLGLLMLPGYVLAASTPYSQYTVDQTVSPSCYFPNDGLQLYDITDSSNSENLGLFPCGSGISFSGTLGHSYGLLELSAGMACVGGQYSDCKDQSFYLGEARFAIGESVVVNASFTPNGPPPPLRLNNTQYVVGEDLMPTCQFARSGLQLYDITDSSNSENLGLFPCGSGISFSGTLGHSYGLLELSAGMVCVGGQYSDCKDQSFYLGEARFAIGENSVSNTSTNTGSSSHGPNYVPGESITPTCLVQGSSLLLYDVTSDEIEFINSYPCGTAIIFDSKADHSYSFLEVVSGNFCAASSYNDCKAQSFFRAEYDFAVADSVIHEATSLTSYRPEVTITAPTVGETLSHAGVITYKATDKNDKGGPEERAQLGMSDKPVSIYYTDKVADWDHSIVPAADKILIVKDQPASGSYTWDAKDLKPGHYYRIVVDAVDTTGNPGEDVSDVFTVDFDAPQFIVAADPPATQGKDVKITVTSNKELKGLPKVTVTQVGVSTSTIIAMTGTSTTFEGVYKVQPGFDGVAKITVSGSDEAGNKGSQIVSGGTFAVGLNPPPAPVITSPADKLVVASSTVDIAGTTRADTTVLLTVNGTDTYTATTTSDGKYVIPQVRLSKTQNKGSNVLSVVARDQVGVSSAAAVVIIKFNIAPTIALTLPLDGAKAPAQTAIDVDASDANGDPLLFTYQIISAKDFNPNSSATSSDQSWVTVAENVPSSRYTWDTTDQPDGEYLLRAIASDGTAAVYSNLRRVSIHNTLPFFKFEDGRKTVTKLSTPTITGRVLEPQGIAGSIGKVEYSVDAGKKWLAVETSPDSQGGVRFSIILPTLDEGSHAILWRAKDSRGLTTRSSHQVVIDTVAPAAPLILSPRMSAVLTSADDIDQTKSGIQIAVGGSAEVGGTVACTFASTTQSVKVGVDGHFICPTITLASRGTYSASAVVTDAAGNTGAAAIAQFTYDNAPIVTILTPKPLRGLKGKAVVSWSVTDADADPIANIALAYAVGGVSHALPIDPTKTSFEWDTSKLPSGKGYSLELSASDGLATSHDKVSFSVDTTPPKLTALASNKIVLGKAGTLALGGSASDDISGVEYVEYALADLGSAVEKGEWFTALITKGFLQSSASYSIKYPKALSDGSYTLYVRAVDAAGNASQPASIDVVVDSSPPRIGGFSVTYMGVSLAPDQEGNVSVYKESTSTIGVSLEGDTTAAELTIGTVHAPLAKDVATGLWQASVYIGSISAPLLISATDAVGNKVTSHALGAVKPLAPGKVTDDKGTTGVPQVSLEVVELHKEIMTAPDGSYVLALPQGSYTITLKKSGYASASKNISLERAGVVTTSFTIEKYSGVWGFFRGLYDGISSIL
jgi:hypothetical protein